MNDENEKRNRNAAYLAIAAVILLCILALFLAVRMLRDLDFSSVSLPFLSQSETPSETDSGPDPQPGPGPSSGPEADSRPNSGSSSSGGGLPFMKPLPTPIPFLPSAGASPDPDPLSGFDTVFFGQYQGHPLEWIVLDTQGSRMLLLSLRAVETLPFHSTDEDVTWESCSLRSWLNGEFKEEAFSEEERSAILATVLDNSGVNPEYHYTKGGAETEDRVFLLSHDEAARYLPTKELRLCEKSPHAPSYTQDISSWWLRSPGLYPNCAEYVYVTGAFFSGMAERMYVDVRPAMWIEKSDGFR